MHQLTNTLIFSQKKKKKRKGYISYCKVINIQVLFLEDFIISI